MRAARVAGERDPTVLAHMARRSMRKKITLLEEAFTGFFTGHHAFLLERMLSRVDAIAAGIAALDATIEAGMAPFGPAVTRLDEIPGINLAAAYVIIAETGPRMTRFPTAGHLVSWATFAPGVKESAGKKNGKNSTGHGNCYLARVRGNAAAATGKTGTFPGARHQRTARRRGANKAPTAPGKTLPVTIWHLLPGPTARDTDPGPPGSTPPAPIPTAATTTTRQLQAPGCKATPEPAA